MSTYAEEMTQSIRKSESAEIKPMSLPWMFGSMALVYLHVFGHGELIQEMKPANIENLHHYGDYLAFQDFVNWLFEQEANESDWFTPFNVFAKWNEYVKAVGK